MLISELVGKTIAVYYQSPGKSFTGEKVDLLGLCRAEVSGPITHMHISLRGQDWYIPVNGTTIKICREDEAPVVETNTGAAIPMESEKPKEEISHPIAQESKPVKAKRR